MGRSSGVNSLDERFLFGIIRPHNGEVPEWPIGAVSKTVVVFLTTVGSNPTLSADRKQPFMVNSNREGFFLVTCRWDTHPLRQVYRSLSASWAIFFWHIPLSQVDISGFFAKCIEIKGVEVDLIVPSPNTVCVPRVYQADLLISLWFYRKFLYLDLAGF